VPVGVDLASQAGPVSREFRCGTLNDAAGAAAASAAVHSYAVAFAIAAAILLAGRASERAGAERAVIRPRGSRRAEVVLVEVYPGRPWVSRDRFSASGTGRRRPRADRVAGRCCGPSGRRESRHGPGPTRLAGYAQSGDAGASTPDAPITADLARHIPDRPPPSVTRARYLCADLEPPRRASRHLREHGGDAQRTGVPATDAHRE
jgi:hypothetical protein